MGMKKTSPTGRIVEHKPQIQQVPLHTEEAERVRRAFSLDPGLDHSPDGVEVDGQNVAIHFDKIEIQGREVRYYLAGQIMLTCTMSALPSPNDVITLNVRGKVEGKLKSA
jgi:hypothetical protein